VYSVTSTGRTASNPYVSMNDVSLIAAFVIVHRAHSIPCNSSTYIPLASLSFFHSTCKIDLLAASACPLVWGCATTMNRAWHPQY